MMPIEVFNNNRGIAILITLTIITIIITASLELHRKMRFAAVSTATARDHITLTHMASSGINAAMAMLVKDKNESTIDSIQEDWANSEKINELLKDIPFENGKTTLTISDELARIQVNALVKYPEGRDFNESQRIMWDRLLRLLFSQDESLKEIEPTSVINSVKDWLDFGDDDAITGLNGAESEYYQDLDPPYSCRNGPIDHLGELVLIKGITRDLYQSVGEMFRISRYMTIYGITSAGKNTFTYKGKINIGLKVPIKSAKDLSLAYTPGVGTVASAIGKNRDLSWQLNNRANTIAIVSDGTAVLGLGNIGPEAAQAVMEGKAAIFKSFADIDAFPLSISTTKVEDIINFAKFLEPSVGGINLEDISAPRCFEILEKLEKELNIPVFHDDQDGTAIVVLAALINSCRVTGKVMKELRIVINGAGAAGIAIARLLIKQGAKDISLLDSRGTIYQGRKNLNAFKKEMAAKTNKGRLKGGLKEAIKGADVLIGVSKAGVLKEPMVRSMNEDPIILALANPVPEIMPDKAIRAGAVIVGTGRSDFPNQVNNALVFPGIFRGLLDCRAKKVTTKMKIGAAIALAYTVKKPTKNKILPNITNKIAVKAITQAICKKA